MILPVVAIHLPPQAAAERTPTPKAAAVVAIPPQLTDAALLIAALTVLPRRDAARMAAADLIKKGNRL